MPRRNSYPTIRRSEADGLWHAWVTVGRKDNGRSDRRHVKRATHDEAREEVDRLLGQARDGVVTKPGQKPTLRAWLATYLDTIAPRKCDPTTLVDYRSKMRLYVEPAVGHVRVDRLTADHLDGIYLAMARTGKADSTIVKTHRILSRALEVAYRRRVVAVNVAKLIDSPTSKDIEIQPLTEGEALKVLAATELRRNAARWSVGLGLGLRQGEALGLRWQYVDLDGGYLRVHWQLHRRSSQHGCGGSCGRRRGGNCPQRVLPMRSGEQVVEGGLILKEPKGKSKRTVPIPPELVDALKAHREVQSFERKMAEGAWKPHGFVFARVDGGPVDPATDYDEWKSLLAAAGVRDARVHDARHTAATLLRAQGVQAEVVQEIMGHSDIRVTRRYTHVATEMARAATDGMGAALLRRRGAP